MNEPLPLDRIPHQPPMLWIRAAERTGAMHAVCEAFLPAECGEGGAGPVLLGIEILAQAGAALLAAAGSGASPEGRLLSVREARWSVPMLPLEVPLQAEVELRQSSAMGLHQFSGRLLDLSGSVLMATEFSLLAGGASE